jgi:hypothetical protein
MLTKLICVLSFFLKYTFNAMHFYLYTVLTTSHKFWNVMFSLSYSPKYFPIFIFIWPTDFFYCAMNYLKVYFLNFQMYGDFPDTGLLWFLIEVFEFWELGLYDISGFEFVEDFFMADNMVHLGGCSVWTWKECVLLFWG